MTPKFKSKTKGKGKGKGKGKCNDNGKPQVPPLHIRASANVPVGMTPKFKKQTKGEGGCKSNGKSKNRARATAGSCAARFPGSCAGVCGQDFPAWSPYSQS
jgi:hypothetical protein